MDSKEVKSLLKEARDQIKNKDYTQSLKTCKSILKLDRENYMALVFLGKSLQEVGPKEQAIHAFKKAINASPEQTLAWHGISSFYEKDDSVESKKELLNVYKKLLAIETEQAKLNDLIQKYVNTAVYLQDDQSFEFIHNLASNVSNSEQTRKSSWLALAVLFSQTKEIPNNLIQMYETTLETILKESSLQTNDYYKEYLKTLYKLKKYEKLFEAAVNMLNIYSNSTYALEWICKVYVELSIEKETSIDKYESQVKEFHERLLQLQNEAVMGLFVQAVLAFKSKKFTLSTDLLKKVVLLRPSLVHAWVMLSECFLYFCDYEEAINACIRAENILQVISRDKLKNIHLKIYIAALARHMDQEKNKLAIELHQKVENPDIDILESLTYAYINLNSYENAKDIIKEISKTDKTKSILLEAKLLYKKNILNDALELLNNSQIETYEVYLETGKLNWDLGNFSNSLVPFLKAAKLNPDSCECFTWLGRYYEEIKDLEKARRCYQKAYSLNPRNAKAGLGLSKIYRQQKNWEANLALLNSITEGYTLGVRNESIRWAWLQLGLHHLHSGDFNLSVDWLRKLVRAESNTAQYWECLADAYLARGSFESAIRSYERSAILSDDNLYAKLQVANVKLKIGHFDDAKIEFEDILKNNKKYVPALKGLGETCLQLGICRNREQRLGSCQQLIQQALDNFTTALKERSDLSCLWKFTADCCYVVAKLPEKYSGMVVHPSLSDNPLDNEDYEIMGREELFVLAARCYCKAITTCKTNNIMLWQDLASCYYSHGLYEKAVSVARYCTQEDPLNSAHWNLLGAAYFHLNKLSMSQHCLIKSVMLNDNSAVSWCNLGALYQSLGDLKLANEAYSRAQRADPNHSTAWTGQALIAQTLGHKDEAMDLFRHSGQLGYGDVSAVCYGSAVCQLIGEKPESINSYEIKNMYALATAWDQLSWYVERNDEDVCAWNILGLISERLGLHRNALKAYQHSVSLLQPGKHRDMALINYARRLTSHGRYEEAISVLNTITEASFSGGCEMALAQFKSGDYEASYETYEASMEWLAESEEKQSHALVALAAMAYMFQGAESAKTLLFQSTQLNPPSKYGLYATFALGLLNSDYNLARLVLKELEPFKDEPDVIYHCAYLDTYAHFLQGDKKKAIRCLSKYIHNHPQLASLWLAFSVLLLQSNDKQLYSSASKCAQLAMNLGRNNMDVTNIFCIVSYACLISGDSKKAVRSAQKAVHCFPHVGEGWISLMAVLNLCKNVKEKWTFKNIWIQNILRFVKGRPLSENMKTWITSFNIN